MGSTWSGGGFDPDDGSEKNWKKYLTIENIERFAPAVAVFPLAMALVVGILGGILSTVLGFFTIGEAIASIVIFLLKAVFCLATLAGAVGLCYVAVTRKDVSSLWTWVAPAAAVFAFISCLSIAYAWPIPAWIFGIISVLIGLELIARITLSNQPMDTPVQPAAAIHAYKQFYHLYREKYPSSEQAEETVPEPTENPSSFRENSEFDGSGIELLGYVVLGALLSAITCGIATPWVICMIYKWRIGHTVINGRRFTFDGSGASLLGHWILWEILTIITCGIYGFFTYVAVRKWELKHTFIDGEPVIPGADTSYFDGNSFEFLGYAILGSLLICITCGIAFPWVMCMIQKWDTKHQIVNGHRMEFNGSGLAFLGQYLLIFLLTLITCGIYSPWGAVRMQKYIIKHTDFVD
jgi:uncharacterized membrane protein YjgN (DUF898 family)